MVRQAVEVESFNMGQGLGRRQAGPIRQGCPGPLNSEKRSPAILFHAAIIQADCNGPRASKVGPLHSSAAPLAL